MESYNVVLIFKYWALHSFLCGNGGFKVCKTIYMVEYTTHMFSLAIVTIVEFFLKTHISLVSHLKVGFHKNALKPLTLPTTCFEYLIFFFFF